MFNSYEQLREQIRAHGLQEIEDRIVQLAKPAILIERTQVSENDIPVGSSKLGGNPDLPADFVWPHWESVPLTFIAQFNLSELANVESDDRNNPLPKQGWLHFFFEADEQAWYPERVNRHERQAPWQVYIIDDPSTELSRVTHPTEQGKYAQIHPLPAHIARFYSMLSVPGRLTNKQRESVFAGIENEETLMWTYWKLIDIGYREPRHHLFGNAMPIQGDIERDCVYQAYNLKYDKEAAAYRYPDGREIDIEQEATKWQFLFQINSDDSLQAWWGDSGTLYVCIPKDSLRDGLFQDCCIELQCY